MSGFIHALCASLVLVVALASLPAWAHERVAVTLGAVTVSTVIPGIEVVATCHRGHSVYAGYRACSYGHAIVVRPGGVVRYTSRVSYAPHRAVVAPRRMHAARCRR